jgi:fimbrial chaperone protein
MRSIKSSWIVPVLVMGTMFLTAFSLEPIVQSFTPAGPGSSRVFSVSNPSDQRIAVRFEMLTRELEPDGGETRNPAGNLFTVFPSRVIVEPRSRQNIRVRWNGPADLNRERAFRLLAEQLPVEFNDSGEPSGDRAGGGAITIVVRYLAAVYVTPEGAQPGIEMRVEDRQQGDSEETGIWIVAENTGTAHAVLRDLTVTVLDGEVVLEEYPSERLSGLAGENLLAGSARRYFLPLDAAGAAQADTVTFRFSQ